MGKEKVVYLRWIVLAHHSVYHIAILLERLRTFACVDYEITLLLWATKLKACDTSHLLSDLSAMFRELTL